MKYCPTCRALTLEALREPDGFPHLQNARGIVPSAAVCDFCNMLRLALLQNKSTAGADEKLESALAPDPIVLYGITAPGATDEDAGPLVGISVHVSAGDTLDIVNLSLFASRGSPVVLSGEVGSYPLLQDPGCDEGFDILRGWLQKCKSGHTRCSYLLSSLDQKPKAPILPSRIVDVSSDPPRLCISAGQKAPYAALSHCWGKIQFLRTLKGNLHSHTQSIPVKTLPKTFRDAIEVTRQVGLRFLWIDSLCIVQDDPDDWRRESAVMGNVYQNAELTIAATGAVDGRQGCFIKRPPSSAQPIAFPGSHTDNGHRFVSVGLYPDALDSDINVSPLGERAWITQEWMLSTRIIHYTAGRMVWACKSSTITEDGESTIEAEEQLLIRNLEETNVSKVDTLKDVTDEQLYDGKLPFYNSWCDFVSIYTCRSLTYERDRPVAMFGIANALQGTIGGRYIAGLLYEQSDKHRNALTDGISWQQRLLVIQLLWFFKKEMTFKTHLEDGLTWQQRLSKLNEMTRPQVLSLQPSWSWQSVMGSVAYHIPPRSARPVAKGIEISNKDPNQPAVGDLEDNSGLCLRLEAPLSLIDPSYLRKISNYVQLWAKSAGDLHNYQSRTSLLTGAMVLQGNLVHMVNKQGEPLGWISFDIDEVPHASFHAVALSENYHNDAFDGYNVLYLATIPGQPTHFRRLGMGEILDKSWFSDSLVQITIY